MKKLFVISLLALVVLAACSSSGKYDAFAQCLTDKGAVFYGAFWCQHCANQKELFGKSFSNIAYVECSTPDAKGQTQVCKDAKIEGYPTWEFADGSRVSGEQTLQSLADKTGCDVNAVAAE